MGVMESEQLGQIRGDKADLPGDSSQLCNGSYNGDKDRERPGGTCFCRIKSVILDKGQKQMSCHVSAKSLFLCVFILLI